MSEIIQILRDANYSLAFTINPLTLAKLVRGSNRLAEKIYPAKEKLAAPPPRPSFRRATPAIRRILCM